MRGLPHLALTLSLATVTLAQTCVIQGPSIGKFDLNGLRKPKSDYEAITNPDGGDITMNFCGAVVGDPVAAGDGAGAYIYDSRGSISLGKYSTVPQYHNGQLSLTYKDGAACPKSNARRSSLIYLQCDKSWSGSDIKLIDSIDDCFYVFTMKTPHACSQSIGGFFSTIWSLTVTLFWILLSVTGGIFIYNRFINKNRSSSSFPGGGNNLSGSGAAAGQLREAVGFVKDMVIIVGVWSLDTAQNLISKFQSRSRNSFPSTSAGGGGYNPYEPLHTPSPSVGPRSSAAAAGQADYSSSAWKATTRTGPPQPPAKDAHPSQERQGERLGEREREEETMPGLQGGGSLLDDDDEDEEGDELTMDGTGGLKV
ncbi:Mrl1p [Sporobolomyces salmoneus]|uniref:Mrl1p n=1 Tax=Sporobolomyces salmoneus TaxID=183962 RepID=UPI00316DDB4A